MNLEKFLSDNHISPAIWEKSGCTWGALTEIALDYRVYREELKETAEFYAKVVQKMPKVHSVRWRIKDENHLLEKIIRKCAEKREKYLGINKDNYSEVVTDLVGLRALHLFKDDCIDIHHAILEKWKPSESPIAFVRDGDNSAETLAGLGLEIRIHPAGYRSLHYVYSAIPMKRQINIELQVRTIFEEGWSEIDHKVRYPNFSDNPLVSYFLTIFNRLAGSADEMGSFVKGLASQLDEMENALQAANVEKENILAQMSETVANLERERTQGKASQEIIDKLKTELDSLRTKSTATSDTINITAIVNGLAKFAEIANHTKKLDIPTINVPSQILPSNVYLPTKPRQGN
ncbi:RelA/SpoT domain-containing protein [Herbaspirillum seropedicae]|uniref:RelA/SpoT domain-containing protein n=1 Tax=Herbaspirillum seropedicae TaxID=964 RepID=UPI0031E39AAF